MATIERYKISGGDTLYRVRHRKPDGKQTSRRGFRTKREAEAYLSSVDVSNGDRRANCAVTLSC